MVWLLISSSSAWLLCAMFVDVMGWEWVGECVDIEGGGREGGCFVFGMMWVNTNKCREDDECQNDVQPI